MSHDGLRSECTNLKPRLHQIHAAGYKYPGRKTCIHLHVDGYSSKLCSIRGYKWIHVAVTDRGRYNLYPRATSIRCKRGMRYYAYTSLVQRSLRIIWASYCSKCDNRRRRIYTTVEVHVCNVLEIHSLWYRIHVDCRWRQVIQVDTTYIRTTCIKFKRGIICAHCAQRVNIIIYVRTGLSVSRWRT